MKTFFSVILCSFLAINLSAKELSPRRTVVAGRVINTTSEDPKILSVSFFDPLNEDHTRGIKLGEDGKFHVEYPMYFSENIAVQYNDDFINLFINPSDSVYLEIDMAKFRNYDYNGLRFSGSGADLNNRFAKFYRHLSSLPYSDIDPHLLPKEYMINVKEVVKKQQDSISTYIKQNNLPPFYEEWARLEIIFSIANYYISEYAPDNIVNRLEVFTDPFLDIYNEDNFQTMIFPYHLNYLLEATLDSDKRYGEYVKNGDYEQAALVGLELLAKFPASLSRDFMTCMLIQLLSADAPDLYAKLPKNLFSDPFFDNLLSKREQPKTVFPNTPIDGISYVNKDNKVSLVPEQDFIKYLTSTYEGKILYIDVYSTWCGPCKKEFPYAKELHKLYKEEVVFINLCLSSYYKQWLPTISEFDIEGENYFFNSDATDLFRLTYKISGYPTYAIIGKNGEIVTMDAPRPSNLPKLKAIIDSLK